MRATILLTALACGIAGMVSAQELIPAPLARALRGGTTLEQYLARVMTPFRGAAGPDGTMTRESIKEQMRRQRAATRQLTLVEFTTLDLDGDGVVTPAETRADGSTPGARTAQRLARRLMAADADGDGSVSLAEAYRHATKSERGFDPASRPSSAADPGLEGYLALGDGERVTAAQVADKAVAAFREVDADGDTVLSRQELASIAGRMPDLRPLRVPPALSPEVASGCVFPAPSAKAQTVLIGTYEGDAIASVHVGNPHEETTSSNIVVQPGETPLYIVVASYEPQIWAVSGAVERVEQFVVAAPEAGERSGVVGLAKDRVAFGGAHGRSCINYFHKSGSDETASARRAFAAAVGREADKVRGIYSLSSVSVPEMEFENLAPRDSRHPAPAGFDPATWGQALRFSPRGLAQFEPQQVISAAPAQAYEVLPQGIGLAQLVASGHLERSRNGYRIVKPIPHFPAGLNGAHSVTFVLAKGVPMPGGSPGHSCVISEETGEPLRAGALCRARRVGTNPDGAFKR